MVYSKIEKYNFKAGFPLAHGLRCDFHWRMACDAQLSSKW
jgi:hypothetical protein